MKRHSLPPRHCFSLLVSLLLAASGCGSNQDTGTGAAETVCPAGVAVVGIGDGYFQNVCGCDEPAGKLFLSPATLTCTAPLGSTVIFQFLATKTLHQVVSIGVPSFPSSPVSDPEVSEFPVRAHAIKPTALGTFRFQDVTNGAIGGILVIR